MSERAAEILRQLVEEASEPQSLDTTTTVIFAIPRSTWETAIAVARETRPLCPDCNHAWRLHNQFGCWDGDKLRPDRPCRCRAARPAGIVP